MKTVVTIFVFVALLLASVIPALARRGNPVPQVTVSNFKSQYYIIDSDDDGTDSRQPTFKFVDTLYDPTNWHRVTGFTNTDDGYAETSATDSILFIHSNEKFRLPPRYISTNGMLKITRDTLSALGFNHPITDAANGPLPAGFTTNYQAVICPLWGDMEFRTTGDSTKVFYRTTADSCYVTYYNLALKGTNGNVRATFQVTFCRLDSSITFNYKSFDGTFNAASAAEVMQDQITIGVQNHQAIYASMYLDRGTYYATSINTPQYAQPLHNSLAVRFIRVIPDFIRIKSIDFPPTDKYEMLSNSFQPKATVENWTDQDLYITVNYKLVDLTTGAGIYNRTDSIQVNFDDYSQDTGSLYQGVRCGSYRLTVTASCKSKGDGWAGDNVMTRDFTLMNTLTAPFYDNFVTLDPCNWHVTGAQWVPADSVMYDPPSPRSTGAIVLNRRDALNQPYLSLTGADTMISAPMNLKNLSNVWLSFSYQRGLSTDSLEAGVRLRTLVGPEPVVHDSVNTQQVYQGDSLIIEAIASTGSEWNTAGGDWQTIATLYGGMDYTTQKFRIQLNSTYLHDHSRLRIRLAAKDDHPKYALPFEDDDNWVLDDIQISAPTGGQTDLEITGIDLGAGNFTHIPRNVKLINPKVTINNNGLVSNGAVYTVHLVIHDNLNRAVYDKTQSLVTPSSRAYTILTMPIWDIQGSQGGVFTAKVNLAQNFNEYYRINDTNTFYRTLYIDDKYALDDGIPDTAGTMTTADNSFYFDFTPLTADSLRGFDIYNLGASGNSNWTINIMDPATNKVLTNGTRAFSYNATAINGGFIRGTFIPFYMTGGTTYRLQCIETQGYGVGGDASKGLMWQTVHSFNNPSYGTLYPSIVSLFRTSTNADYVTAKRNGTGGGPILPMIRPVFQGSSTYLPVEVASFAGKRTDLGSVNLAFQTAKEESVDHFDVDRETASGWVNVGAIGAKNDKLGAKYALLDENAPSTNLTYRLMEVDLDGSQRLVGTTAVGPYDSPQAFNIKIYPNPASQTIHVSLTGGASDVSLLLYDALGKVVAQREHVSANSVEFDASALSAGSYWLEARNGENNIRTKVSVIK